jgi:parallel beta-helix repeat protein
MKHLYLSLFILACTLASAQSVPELIYYKFNGTGTTVPNEASTPAGTNPAQIVGTSLTQGPGGQFGNGLIGTGGTSSSNYVNTGWNLNLGTGSWTISMYLGNVSTSSTLFYYFGESSNSFRCFTNGVAGAGNLMLRGSSITDVTITGAAVSAGNVVHFVYDQPAGVIRGYLNGVLQTTVNQGSVNLTGGSFTVGGYASSAGHSGIMDEFRLYNRALDAQEIASTWNNELPLISGPNDAGVVSIDSPQNFCAGVKPVEVTIRNYGSNIINSVAINWTINGVAQTPVQWNTPLDTFGGQGANTAKVQLGTYNFQSGSYTLRAWTSNPNGVADTINHNDTSQAVVGPSLSGTFTIGGSSPDYATFNDAVSALSNFGVCGPVVFNVRPGNYTEQVTIQNIVGTSASNTVLFQSETGDSTSVNLTFSSSVTSSNYTLRIAGSSHITFRKMTLRATGPTFGRVIEISGGSTNITIASNRILGPEAGSTSVNYASIYSASNEDDNLTIEHNYVRGGSYGVYLRGTGTTALEDGLIVRNNIFEPYYMGVYLYYQKNATIEHNTIRSNSFVDYNFFYGIYGGYVGENSSILANQIDVVSGAYGIYLFSSNGSANPGNVIANNFVHVGGTGTAYGLYISSGQSNQKWYYNSVNITSSNLTSGRAIYKLGTGTNIRVFNNNLVNSSGGYTLYYTGLTDSSAYNNLYNDGGNSLAYASAVYTDLSSLRTATGLESNSISVDPIYTSQTDLHAGPTISGQARPFPEVTVDIDGTTRSTQTPAIGAHEVVPSPVDLAVVDILWPFTACNLSSAEQVVVVIRSFGQATLPANTVIQFETQIDNNPPQTESFALPKALSFLDTLKATLTNTVNLSAPGAYQLRVKVSIPADGNFKNDQLTTEVRNNYVNDFPIIADFEDWGPKVNTPSCNIANGIAHGGWEQPADDDGSWNIGQGPTPTTNTGPSYDFSERSIAGKYLYIESDFPCYGTPGPTYLLRSPCIDLGVLSNPGMNFAYHMHGTATGSLHIDIIRNDGSVIDNIWSRIGAQGNKWQPVVLSLEAYKSEGVVQIQFRAIGGTGTTSDIALDDIRIGELPVVNLGPSSVTTCGFIKLDTRVDGGKHTWSTGDTSRAITIINHGLQTITMKIGVMVEKDGLYAIDSMSLILEPGPYVDLGPDRLLLCGQDSLILDAQNPTLTHAWDNLSTGQTRVVNESGMYHVTVDDGKGCIKSDTIEVVFEEFPVATFAWDNVTYYTFIQFNSNGSTGTSYHWDFGDGNFSDLEDPKHYFASGGQYTVMLVVENECGTDTFSQSINVFNTGIGVPASLAGLAVSPNPSNGQFTISLDVKNPGEWMLTVTDLQGRNVYREALGYVAKQATVPVDLSRTAKGIYLLQLHGPDGVASRQLVVQ